MQKNVGYVSRRRGRKARTASSARATPVPTEQHTSEKLAWLDALEAACHPSRASSPAASPPESSPSESSPSPADLDTATLAALYVRQGLFDRAVSVYERMLARDPGNTRLAVALEETRRLAREATRPRPGGTPQAPPPPSAPPAPAASPARVAVAGGAAPASASDGISIREQLRGILDGEAPGAAFLEASRREWLDGLGSLG